MLGFTVDVIDCVLLICLCGVVLFSSLLLLFLLFTVLGFFIGVMCLCIFVIFVIMFLFLLLFLFAVCGFDR